MYSLKHQMNNSNKNLELLWYIEQSLPTTYLFEKFLLVDLLGWAILDVLYEQPTTYTEFTEKELKRKIIFCQECYGKENKENQDLIKLQYFWIDKKLDLELLNTKLRILTDFWLVNWDSDSFLQKYFDRFKKYSLTKDACMFIELKNKVYEKDPLFLSNLIKK